MARKNNKPLTVDDLWHLERLGAPSLSPDGAQCVASLGRYSMDDNKANSSLWLFSTLGGAPRALTHCGEKDGQPRWSPHRQDGSEAIGFVAKREQQGKKDDEPQFYVIAPDGGEARRVGQVATGIEAFRWFPDGERIAFVSWVWPEVKGTKAQAAAHKVWKERKESAYVTSQAQYRHWDHNVPMGRVPHLHLMQVQGRNAGSVRDLFEGTTYELARTEPDANCFDISPDGQRVVFAFDPAREKRGDDRFALAELDLKSGKRRTIALDAEWDFAAPRYSPDGEHVAFLASHQGAKHTMPAQLALWQRERKTWSVPSAEWDHEVHAPLAWEADGQALLFATEQKGQRHLWRFDLPDRRAEIVVAGGWVQAFDKAAGTLVTLADSVQHPGRLHAHAPGEAPRRIEHVNDELLGTIDLGHSESLWFTGAQGDSVQLWLTYPPGFDGRKKTALLHNIHGGPHTAAGDTWHYRWNTHVFAAQGYVVASVNFHGSSSFGYAFLDSITHRWGALETEDIEAATTLLLKKPWADRKRVFAAGGSYGGFMAAWLNGHVKPGRYAAYICHAGCFDWTAMFADDAYTWHAQELGAWYWDDPARIAAQSPHAFAAAMKTPTLVIHGALDYRVPDAQGLAYYNTLKAQRVPARLVWFPDENHWVLKPRNSKLWYREFFDWLAKHDAGTSRRRAPAA